MHRAAAVEPLDEVTEVVGLRRPRPRRRRARPARSAGGRRARRRRACRSARGPSRRGARRGPSASSSTLARRLTRSRRADVAERERRARAARARRAARGRSRRRCRRASTRRSSSGRASLRHQSEVADRAAPLVARGARRRSRAGTASRARGRSAHAAKAAWKRAFVTTSIAADRRQRLGGARTANSIAGGAADVEEPLRPLLAERAEPRAEARGEDDRPHRFARAASRPREPRAEGREQAGARRPRAPSTPRQGSPSRARSAGALRIVKRAGSSRRRHLRPRERHRDRRARARPHRERRGDQLAAPVLQEVDVDLARRARRSVARSSRSRGARRRPRARSTSPSERALLVVERPPSGSSTWRPSWPEVFSEVRRAELVEQRVDAARDRDHVRERRALRIEVEDQPVGPVERAAPRAPHVQRDRARVDHVEERAQVVAEEVVGVVDTLARAPSPA